MKTNLFIYDFIRIKRCSPQAIAARVEGKEIRVRLVPGTNIGQRVIYASLDGENRIRTLPINWASFLNARAW